MYVTSGKTADEIIRMLVAGASISIDATVYALPELIRMAAVVGAKSGSMVILRNAGHRRTEELIRLAAISHGRMTLEI